MPMRLRLTGVARDEKGNLYAEAIETWSGRKIATGIGEYTGTGFILIEKGAEGLFDFKEPKK